MRHRKHLRREPWLGDRGNAGSCARPGNADGPADTDADGPADTDADGPGKPRAVWVS